MMATDARQQEGGVSMASHEWVEKDFYKVLGVPSDADSAAIKKAYRTLARDLHPDVNKDNPQAEARFKAVSEAYAVLSDDAKRKEYDEVRRLYQAGGRPGGGGGPFPGGINVDLGDLFGQGASGVGDLFGGLFGGSRSGPRPRRGSDIRAEHTFTFEEAVRGKTVRLRLASAAPCDACRGTGAKAGTVPTICPTCEGTGHTSRGAGDFSFSEPCRECGGRGMVVKDPCPICHGSGRGERASTIEARIPAGVKDGATVRLRGKGAPGEGGGPPGDLLVKVRVTKHPVFTRDGDNLRVTVPVSFAEAALGGEIDVPTLDGTTVRLKLAEGTRNGQVLRARGKGVPRKDGTPGDLLVTVEVAVPQRLSNQARAAVEALAAATDTNVRAELIASAQAAARRAAATA
jgi:molecular chaperone DnaJ